MRQQTSAPSPPDNSLAAKGVWPNVVDAMREIGVEIGGRRPKNVTVEMQLHADWPITLACGATCPYADRTAHQVRPEQLIPGLAQEFEGLRSAAEIRTCADAILAQYDEVPIRSHVMRIANRQTRDCLRAEHCDTLALA